MHPDKFIRHILRQAVLLRDGDKCFYCGKAMDIYERTIEHLDPKSRGGLNDIDNVVLAHSFCNLRYGTLTKNEKMILRDFNFGRAKPKPRRTMGWKAVAIQWLIRKLEE